MRELTALRAHRAYAARLLDSHRWAVRPTLTSIAASGTAAATTLIIARGIGAAAFGQFTVVLTIALIVSVGMLMSLNYVMYQDLPRAQPWNRSALVTTALCSTLVLTVGVIAVGLLASPLLTALLGIDLRTLCYSLALAMAVTMNQLTDSVLRGLKRFAFVANLKFAVAVAYLVASSLALILLDIRNAEFYLVALIVMYVAFAVVALAALEVNPRSWSAARARSLYRHGAYVTAIAALVAVLFGIDVILLNRTAGQADVGAYSVYNGFPKRLLVVLLTEGIGVVLLPTLATMDKPSLLRRIRRIAPAVGIAMAVFSLAASAVCFLLLRGQYPYSLGLMALSAVGIGAHTVFHLYLYALSMDGVRGAKVFIACLIVGLPAALTCQALFIARWGLVGALVAFAITNFLLVAVVVFAAARLYRPADSTGMTHVPEVAR
jgi:O-antigen/teichoic acid export membrane protein